MRFSSISGRKPALAAGLGFLFWLMVSSSHAAVLGIGVTAKAGTTGVGGDLTVPLLTNWVNLRAGYNWLSFDLNLTEGGLKYDADVDLQNVPILLDVHPFHGSFRVSAGVFYNKNEIGLSTFAGAGTVIGGTAIGTATNVNGTVDWSEEWAPYFGIGWGNAADDNFLDLPVAIGFSMDVGVFYQGNPNVTLSESSGLVSPANLRAEEREIEDDLSDFKWYPVVTFGVHIRF